MVRFVVVVVVGGIVTSAVAMGAVLVGARLAGSWSLSVAAGALAGIVVVCLCARFAPIVPRRRPPARPRRWPGVVALATVTLLATATWAVPHSHRVTPPAPQGVVTASVDRPDGTHLALFVRRAQHATRPPLVFVHGGPGVADPVGDTAAMSAFAADRDVYVYDQIGTGTSSRLADVAGYTLSRAVADLAAVVRRTGAARVELMGFSYGARIATRYAVAHPDRVASLVLVAPGEAPVVGEPFTPQATTAELTLGERASLYAQLVHPRSLFIYGLTVLAPRVAHRAIGDTEADARFAAIYAHLTPGLFCDHTLAARVGTDGVGYFANQTPPLLGPGGDLVPARAVSGVTAPVLVVKPACDYIPWGVAATYVRLLPNARLVLLPDAGHAAYVERPRLFDRLVRAFWAGSALPLPVQDPARIPERYRGVR